MRANAHQGRPSHLNPEATLVDHSPRRALRHRKSSLDEIEFAKATKLVRAGRGVRSSISCV
jgi:hypothetical protein